MALAPREMGVPWRAPCGGEMEGGGNASPAAERKGKWKGSGWVGRASFCDPDGTEPAGFGWEWVDIARTVKVELVEDADGRHLVNE